MEGEKTVVASREDGERIKQYVRPVIKHAYILSDDRVVSEEEVLGNIAVNKLYSDPNADKVKSSNLSVEDGSAQNSSEEREEESFTLLGQDIPIVEPPYDVVALSNYLQKDEIHYRCCLCKAIDSVGRGYTINPRPDLLAKGADFDDNLKKTIETEIEIIRAFIRTCNQANGFIGVLMQAALAAEGVGFSAIEVIRGKDKLVKRIANVPPHRIRVLRGWKGFVEDHGRIKGQVYYLPFGKKLLVRDDAEPQGYRSYDPFKDDIKDAEWNLINRYTGERVGIEDFENSANEIIWIQKFHPSTTYYGLSDIIPALSSVIANIYISIYGLQFFENNAIPHYAIVVEGADFSPEVAQLIKHYFKNEIKGENRSTLIIPVPGASGEVRVRFERLSSEEKEGSFQQYRKNNQQAIMVAHGVSPAIIGVMEAASLGSGKGRAQYENYRDRIIEPLQRFWEDKINNLFQKGLGIKHVILEFDEYNIQDDRELSEVVMRYVDRGILSINEGRKMAKLGDPIKGGDKHYIKVGRDLIDIESLNLDLPEDKGKNVEEKIQETLEYINNNWEDIEVKILKSLVNKSPACRLSGETVQQCVSRKIPEIIRENPDMERDRAIAIAYSLCSKPCKEEQG